MINNSLTVFEEAKKYNDFKSEYWSARELARILEYIDYRNFDDVVNKAKESCRNSGQSINYHFVDFTETIQMPKNASKRIKNVMLSHYACYLIMQNADPSKEIVARGQTYFAIQTRKQEISEQYSEANKWLESTIKALYGGISTIELKKKRNIPPKRALADFDTTVELKAKDFALAMTDHNIKEKNLRGSYRLNEEVIKNSKATRQTLLSRGIKPENLQPQEDLKKIETRRKKELTKSIK